VKRKPHLVVPPPPTESVDVRSPGDFSDPESRRVLDTIADALVAPLAHQKARDDFAEWVACRVSR
jgi:hypothetical protein